MKKINFYMLFLCTVLSMSCKAQPNENIVKYFKNSRYINLEQTLFTPLELIELCNDSLGRITFTNSVRLVGKIMKSSNEAEVKEKKVLFSLIKNQIQNITENQKNAEGKAFINNTLSEFNIDFIIDESLLSDRFNAEDDLTFCTTCISMYIFFIYNPELYIKVRTKERDFNTAPVHFPLAYILQDCNTPIEITTKMQQGLLERIKNYEDPILKKIYSEIESCDLNNRCD